MKDDISSLQHYFGAEHADRLLSFAMMRWAYQTPINATQQKRKRLIIS
jgi:hypothetical protein